MDGRTNRSTWLVEHKVYLEGGGTTDGRLEEAGDMVQPLGSVQTLNKTRCKLPMGKQVIPLEQFVNQNTSVYLHIH